MKKLYLIAKKDGKNDWTKSYEKKDGFVIYTVVAKDGKEYPKELSLSEVKEISFHELKEDDASGVE